MKHVPERTCIVCRGQKPKAELVRIVRGKDGVISLDPSGRAPGRGAYICRTGGCIDSAAKKRVLDRVYKTQVDAATYAKLAEDFGKL